RQTCWVQHRIITPRQDEIRLAAAHDFQSGPERLAARSASGMDRSRVALNSEIAREQRQARISLAAAKADWIRREAFGKHCFGMKLAILGASGMKLFQISIRHSHHASPHAAAPSVSIRSVGANSRVSESFFGG